MTKNWIKTYKFDGDDTIVIDGVTLLFSDVYDLMADLESCDGIFEVCVIFDTILEHTLTNLNVITKNARHGAYPSENYSALNDVLNDILANI